MRNFIYERGKKQMKKGKKIVALLLCGCMMASLMVGLSPVFGATSEEPKESENPTSETATTADPSSVSAEEEKESTPPKIL